jgi:hypothetical protein
MTLAVSALVAGRDPAVEALELAEAVAHEIGPDPVLAPQQSPGHELQRVIPGRLRTLCNVAEPLWINTPGLRVRKTTP